MVHTFDRSTPEAEADGTVSSRPDWSTKQGPGWPGLYRKTLCEYQGPGRDDFRLAKLLRKLHVLALKGVSS